MKIIKIFVQGDPLVVFGYFGVVEPFLILKQIKFNIKVLWLAMPFRKIGG